MFKVHPCWSMHHYFFFCQICSIAEWPHFVYLFISSSKWGIFGWSYFLAMMNNATMSIHVQLFAYHLLIYQVLWENVYTLQLYHLALKPICCMILHICLTSQPLFSHLQHVLAENKCSKVILCRKLKKFPTFYPVSVFTTTLQDGW